MPTAGPLARAPFTIPLATGHDANAAPYHADPNHWTNAERVPLPVGA